MLWYATCQMSLRNKNAVQELLEKKHQIRNLSNNKCLYNNFTKLNYHNLIKYSGLSETNTITVCFTKLCLSHQLACIFATCPAILMVEER